MSNPEGIHFKSQEEEREEQIIGRIKEKGPNGEILGGIVYEEEEIIDPETGQRKAKGYIYIGNPYEERPIVVKLETEATREDVEAIKKEIIPMKESYEMLTAMAQAYKLRQLLLIEGPTAIGKTFLVDKFTELLYGKGIKPLDFYCSGQTDVSELMAKWVPKTESGEERKKWEKFLETAEAQTKLSQIAQEVEGKEEFSQEQRLALVRKKLQELAEYAGLSGRTQWSFQYGSVPKAMGLIRNPDGSFSFDEEQGEGFILHIQEIGLAEPQVVNALLKLRGERGELAKEIQLWENGGRRIKAGPKFWVVFSTNPPEEYLARNEVDPALARGVVFKRMEDLPPESLVLAAEYYFTYQLGDKPQEKPEGCILDIWNYPEIGKLIARIISIFHTNLNKELQKGEKGRQQRIPLALDDMARVAAALIEFQIRDRDTGRLDLTETLRRHITYYYIDRLADEDLKKVMKESLNQLLKGDVGKIEFEGKVLTLKEVFDILVKRASMAALSEEQRGRTEEEERQREERELRQVKFDASDSIARLLENPDLSEEIRSRLGNILR